MRRWWSGILSLATLLAPGSVLASSLPKAPEATLLITNVSVIDTEDGQVSGPTDILVEDGRITALAPSGALSVPAGTPHLDGSGRFALPGLIDVHAHVGLGGATPEGDEERVRALGQFLRYGVTTIFVPGATGAGDSEFPALRQRCSAREIACPGLHGSGSLITAPGSHPVGTIFAMPDDVDPERVEALGVTLLGPGDDVDGLIARKAESGVDAIKIVVEEGPPPWFPRPRLSDEDVRSIVRSAHARSLPVFAHVSASSLAQAALKSGVDGILHAPIDDMPDSLVNAMAQRRMWYVTTFSLFDGILAWARKARETDPYALKGVDPSVIDSLAAPPFLEAAAEDEATALSYLEKASANLRKAASAGVPIALGTDVNNPFVYPGYSAHEELSWMAKAGLTPLQALRAATLGGAAFLGAADRLGRIAVGFEADILLLSSNPLDRIENSRSLAAVIADGRIVEGVVTTD